MGPARPALEVGARRLLSLATTSTALLAALVQVPVARGDDEPLESGYDKVWGHTRLYEGDEDGFFQSFALSGRL